MDMFVILCSVAIIFTVSPSRATSDIQPDTGPTSVDNGIYLQLLSRVQYLEQREKEQQADINKRVQHLEQREKEQQADINKLRAELHTERQRTSKLERRLLELTTRGRQGSKKAGDEVGRQKHLGKSVGSVKDIRGDDSARKNEGIGNTCTCALTIYHFKSRYFSKAVKREM